MYRIAALFLLLAGALMAEPLAIVTDCQSPYVIAVPDAATKVEQTAAEELQKHLELCTGVRLPVWPEKVVVGWPAFYVGATTRFQQHFGSNDRLKQMDAIAIGADGRDIILGGHPDRGSLYAVYEFLERYLLARWWTAEDSLLLRRSNLSVSVEEYVYAPPLSYREVYYLGALEPEFASKLRSNGFWTKLTPEYGGKLSVYGWCHTFEQIMPPNKFFAEHPEWFALVDGQRVGEGAQLCLTNKEMRREFLKLTLGKIERNPGLWQMSVSQNDNHKWCQCPSCAALAEAEGGQSGPLLDFVNEIARGVAEVYPDMPVSTLAYQKSRHVPKTIRPEPNVCIWLCNIENNFGQSVEDGPDNADFNKDLQEWSAISSQLFIWNYTAFFYNFLVPHPNHADIGRDIRYFVKNKARGVFPQGDYYCNIGDFVAMRAYVMGRLLWDPSRDERQEMREFLNGYYGPQAAPYLLDYLDFICQAQREAKIFLSCYRHLHTYDWLTPEVFTKAYAFFDQAAKAAASPVFAERIRRERLSLDTAYLEILPAQIREARRLNQPLPSYGPAFQPLLDEYAALTAKYKPTHYALSRPWPVLHYTERLRTAIQNALDTVPAACADIPGDRWQKFEDREFTLYRVNPQNEQEKWAELVSDPAAGDGSAIMMPANHREWAAQLGMVGCSDPNMDFTNDREGVKKKITALIYARAEGESDTGAAISFGIYSHSSRRELVSMTIPLSEAKGSEYKCFSLTPTAVDNDLSFFVAPPARPAVELARIFIDKIVMVREE